jgi:TonB family protein
MEAQVQLHDYADGEVCLLPDWHARENASRGRTAGIASVLLHFAGILALILFQLGQPEPAKLKTGALEKSTPLIAPPLELTQTEPNRGKIGREFKLENLLPRPRVFVPPAPVSTELPPPVVRPPAPAIAAPPKLDAPQALAQLPPAGAPAPPPPQIQAKEKPKVALETPGVQGGASANARPPALKVPSTSVDEAVRNMSPGRTGSTPMVVGDTVPGIGEGMNLPSSRGRNASTLELLSDPMGVDFHPYLIRILATVKRNWLAVTPESAKMGGQGRVAIVFAINRDGKVPKLVIATPSGTEALDRAAVAGISASNPFPPLPNEFKGEQIRLQFTFLYNVRRN